MTAPQRAVNFIEENASMTTRAPRKKRSAAAIAVGALSVAGVLALWATSGGGGSRALADGEGGSPSGVLPALLVEHSAAERLACGGVLAADVQNALAALAAELQTVDALEAAQNAAASAQRAAADCRQALWRHGARSEFASSLAAADAGATSAAVTLASAGADVRALIDGALHEHTASADRALAQRVALRASSPLPAHHQALDVANEQWRRLERAWRLNQRGLPLTQAESSALAAAEADPVAQLVAARVQTNAAAIKAVLDEAMRQEWIAQQAP